MSLKNEKAKRETCRKLIFLQENIKLHILLIKIKNNEKNPIFSQIKNLKIKNTIQVRNFLHLFRWKNPNFLTKTWVLIFFKFFKIFLFFFLIIFYFQSHQVSIGSIPRSLIVYLSVGRTAQSHSRRHRANQWCAGAKGKRVPRRPPLGTKVCENFNFIMWSWFLWDFLKAPSSDFFGFF